MNPPTPAPMTSTQKNTNQASESFGRSMTAATTLASTPTAMATTAPIPTAFQSTRLIGDRSRPLHLAEGVGEPELPGVEDAVGIEDPLQRREHLESGTQCLPHEPAAIQAHAVVVAERTAPGEHRACGRVPHGDVERVALFDGRLPGEGEIQAGSVAVGGRLVGRHPED